MTFLAYYLLAGLIYVLINGFVRKIYEDDDMWLVIGHLFVWPIFLGLLIYDKTKRLFKTGK